MTSIGIQYSPGALARFLRNNQLKSSQAPLLQCGLSLFFFLIVVLAWVLTINQLKENRKFIIQSFEREQTNLTAIISENLYQVLDQNQALRLIAMGWMSNRNLRFPEEIINFIYSEQAFNRIVLFDMTGQQIYQTSPKYHKVPDDTEIKRLLAGFKDGQSAITLVPAANESNVKSWQVPILFPLNTDREIIGGMLLELNLGYLLNLFQSIDIGRSGDIFICSQNGQTLAHYENGGLTVDRQGSICSKSEFSGKTEQHNIILGRKLTSSHSVKNYPLKIIVAQNLQERLSEFNEYRRQQVWILGFLTFIGTTGFTLLIQMINRKHHYMVNLAASHVENRKLIEKLEQEHRNAVNAASFDPLTGLYNRRLFVSLAQQNLFLAKRNQYSYGVLFIDLDRFKTINDTLGHRIGDLLLKTIAKRLKGCVRQSDIVSRLGGDEFVIMLTGITAVGDISPVVEKIINAVSQPCELDGHHISVSPSIGVAISPRDGEDIETLLRHADAAMYSAKKSGRGRFSYFDGSLNSVSVQQFELEQGISSAIENDEFILYYQPKIRLTDSRVVGLEALIRWQHPRYNLLFPGDFIDRVEESGMIGKLGEWVLDRSCRQLVTWRELGIETVPVAINVSPTEIKEPEYAGHFLRTVEKHGLSPGDFEIEITESAVIEDKKAVSENLNTLAAEGVRISLDDFGNGYSSFSHIRSLPIQTLKIDRSFIQDIRSNRNDNAIVTSTIALAQKLDLTVIAEGIESNDQLVHLKLAGCDQVQGYYFSRPVPEDDILDFLHSPIRNQATA